MTIPEIRAELEEKGIAIPEDVTLKADLLALLPTDEASSDDNSTEDTSDDKPPVDDAPKGKETSKTFEKDGKTYKKTFKADGSTKSCVEVK